MDKMIKVGEYKQAFNTLLGLSYDLLDIYRSKGLPSHMVSRKHFKALKYIDNIPDIIGNPDYIGINPNEGENSIELVKTYRDNIIIGIKLDTNNQYYYIATMFDIPQAKLDRSIHAGRLKKYIDMYKENDYDIDADDISFDEPEKVPGAPEEEPDMVDDRRPPKID